MSNITDELVLGALGHPPPVHVVVAVAVHDRRDLTVSWIESLASSDLTNLAVDIVMVDDGSADGTPHAARQAWPGIEIVPGDGTLFYDRGTNRAVRHALRYEPDFILAANDDSRYEHDTLRWLVHCALIHPRSVVGGLLLRWDDPAQVFQVFPRWDTSYGGWRHRQHLAAEDVPPRPFDVDLLVGNCLLVPADAVLEVGLMLERGRHNWVGDAEWTPRMRRAGWQLLVEPRARVLCQPNAIQPSPLRGGAKATVRALTDPVSPYALRRLWANRVRSAPDPALGMLGFTTHLARLAGKAIGLGRWPNWPDEAIPGRGARIVEERSADAPLTLVLGWLYLPWGGAQTHLLTHAACLSATFCVRALVPDGTDRALSGLLTDSGAVVETYGPPIDLGPATTLAQKVRRRWRDARAHVAFAKRVRRFDPATTVLHVDMAPWSTSLLLRWLTRRFTVVQTLHTAPPRLSPLRRRIWRSRLELVLLDPPLRLAMGNRDARQGFERLLGRPLGAVDAPTSVDLDLVDAALAELNVEGERRVHRIPAGTPLVVGIGQLIERKGVDVAIAAVAELRKAGLDVHLRWIGRGDERATLESLAARKGVDDLVAVVDPGELSGRAALFATLASADVYIQPSREEGLPLALVEAMALGVPVVGAEVNAIPEVIVDGETGLLVDPGDPSSLAAAIRHLIDDPGHARQLAHAGSELIREHHDAAVVASRLGHLYRRALADR